jgi:hypothetical protein
MSYSEVLNPVDFKEFSLNYYIEDGFKSSSLLVNKAYMSIPIIHNLIVIRQTFREIPVISLRIFTPTPCKMMCIITK